MTVDPNNGKNSNNEKPVVLIVDDQFRSFRSLIRLISSETFDAIWASDERDGLKILKNQSDKVKIIIIDLKSSEIGGGGFLQHARLLAPKAAILITGPLGPFLYQGGNFYECSGFGLKHNINEVLFSIAQKMKNGRESSITNQKKPKRTESYGTIIGQCEGINEIYRLIEKLKTSSSTVLISGESGTGKELIAQTIHQTSSRRNRPFVAINCGAIPSNLIESELFGHERGAFTTAITQRKGKFEVAEGGTLFLDEISELDKELQVKLLRVLQEKEYQRVGGNRTHRTDVRIIAATSRDLIQAVKSKDFRDDLFFRLNVVPIHIPPLRERKEDIPLLLSHFFEKLAQQMERNQPMLTKAAEKALCDYNYPGNVRELINIVERLIVTCPGGHIAFNDLPGEICSQLSGTSEHLPLLNNFPSGGVRLNEMEKELIFKTLEMTGGNKTEAARMLGITRRRLYLRLSTYGCN
jgi:DNA-binding NtrC family response regulator